MYSVISPKSSSVANHSNDTASKSAVQRKSNGNDVESISQMISGGSGFSSIQTKLIVGKSNDKYEQQVKTFIFVAIFLQI